MIGLFDNLLNFTARVDKFCEEASVFYSDALACKKGCSSCCVHFGLFPVEAFFVRFVFDKLDSSTVKYVREKSFGLLEGETGSCPLLKDDLCVLYAARPIICRTHGLPVLVRTDKDSYVDVCPLNFTSEIKPDKNYILDLDQLNTTLVSINKLFLREAFDGIDIPERILLAEALVMDIDFS